MNSAVQQIRRRGTYANLMATVAVLFSLAGTSYAALSIRSADIVDNSIQSRDLRDGDRGVRGRDVANGSLAGTDIRNESVGLADLSAVAETALKLPPKAYMGADGSPMSSTSGTLHTSTITLGSATKLLVIGRIVGGLICTAAGPCMQKFAVYVDGTYVPGSAVVQSAPASTTTGLYPFALVGVTGQLAAGSHTMTIMRGDTDPDWGGSSTGSTHIAAIAVS